MSERYDYRYAVRSDVKEYIEDNIDLADWKGNRDGLEEKLREDLWVDDSVTGNASGSYYCNSWKAEEAVAHNWGLLAEAVEEFDCSGVNVFDKGAEWADVTIRCYLLYGAISEVLDDLEDELEPDDEDDEEEAGEDADNN